MTNPAKVGAELFADVRCNAWSIGDSLSFAPLAIAKVERQDACIAPDRESECQKRIQSLVPSADVFMGNILGRPLPIEDAVGTATASNPSE